MQKVSGIAAALLLLAAMSAAQSVETKSEKTVTVETAAATAESSIRAELDAQVAAWNRGDLKEYMGGYWHSQELTFFAGNTEAAGWEAAYQRYRAAYRGKGKEMGKLKFSNLRVEALSGETAFVRGRWQLSMKNGSKRSGLFTVVLKKFSEGWKIIHDHSS